ncbi:MAG: hypothetical protein Q4G58_17120, partial [bacterium]|nr:hypothetical protein [bacterium]
MHKGNYEAFTKEGYLQTYPQQAGLILFYYFVSFLLGSSTVLGLQIINVFAYVCFIYCIYHIALLLWKNTTIAAFSGVLTFSFLPLLFYTTFVYGTLIGLALSTLSILKALEFIRKQKVSSAIFCSIFAGCSVVIKKNYIIAVVAIVLVLLVYGIVKRHWSLFICSLLLLIATLSFTKITSMAMESISGCTLGDGMPSITWVTMGLQEGYRADGWYNRYTINTFVDNDFDPIATKQQAKKDLHNELSKFLHNKQYAVSFFYKKTASQWCEPTFQSLYINKVYSSYGERKFTTPPFIMSLIVKVLLPALDLFLSIALIGVMMYLLYNREQIKLLELLPGIVFLGGFLFHLFWEAKGQYTITYFVLLFPYCVKGYSCIYKRIEEVLLDQSHKDIASRWRSIACIYHAIRPVTRLLIVLLIFNIITLVVPSVKATTNRFDQTYYTYLYNSGSEKKKSKVPTGKFIISTFDKKGYLDFSLKKPD